MKHAQGMVAMYVAACLLLLSGCQGDPSCSDLAYNTSDIYAACGISVTLNHNDDCGPVRRRYRQCVLSCLEEASCDVLTGVDKKGVASFNACIEFCTIVFASFISDEEG